MEVAVEGRRVRLTHLEKVLYPQTGFTKAEAVDYYAAVAGALLPHLAGRPLTLRRYLHGVGGPSRFEKCCPDHRPDWLHVVRIPRKGGGQDIPFCAIDDLPSLMWSVNALNLELHPMLSAEPELDRPTAVAFDLDPGPPAGLAECREVALLLRTVLDAAGLRSHVKTSGGKGLQAFVAVNTAVTYAETKAFARAIAGLLARQVPELVTDRVTRRERPGRVLVDWGQNDRHKSIVAPYSLRGRPRPTVSTPITWPELEDAAPEELVFGPDAARERLERQGDLWAGVPVDRQVLPQL